MNLAPGYYDVVVRGTQQAYSASEDGPAEPIGPEAPYVEIAKARVAHEAAQGSLFK